MRAARPSASASLELFQRKTVRNHSATGKRSRKHQPRGLLLPIHRGAITAQNFFFLDADGRGRKLDLHVRIVLREQQHAPAGPRERQALRSAPQGNGTATSTTSAPRPSVRARISLRQTGRHEDRKPRRRPSARSRRGAPASGSLPNTVAPAKLRQHHQQQPDRPLSHDHNRLAGGHARLLDRLQAGVHRLDERGFLETHVVRNLPPCRARQSRAWRARTRRSRRHWDQSPPSGRLSCSAGHWENRRRSQ